MGLAKNEKRDEMHATCDHAGCTNVLVLDLATGIKIAAFVLAKYDIAVTGVQLCEGQATAKGWFAVPCESPKGRTAGEQWICPRHPEVRRG